MSDIQTLKSYLVSLGFTADMKQFRMFQGTLKEASSIVKAETGTIAANLLKWQLGIVGMFGAISGAVLAATDKVAMADQEYRLFGERMFMDTAHARGLKVALDALHEPLNAIAFDPELHSRFNQLLKDQGTMAGGLGGGYEGTMKQIRDIRFEFTRFQVEIQYLLMGTVGQLFKSLGLGSGNLLQSLQKINEWIIHHIPQLSKQFSDYLVPILKDSWQILKDVGELVGMLATQFANFIGVISGDRSIEGSTFSFDKFAKAIEKVVHWVATALDYFIKLEHVVKALVPTLAGMSAGAGIGATIGILGGPVGAGTGALVGGGLGLAYSAIAGLHGDSGAVRGTSSGGSSIVQQIAAIATQYGVDPRLAIAVAMQESGTRQFGKDGNPLVNRGAHGESHATGIFQLEPGIARMLGVNPNDTTQNIIGGVLYLKQLTSKYHGDTNLALQHYYGSRDAGANASYAQQVMNRESGINIGSINIMQPNATPDQITRAVADGVKQHQGKQIQRNLSELASVYH